MRKIGRETPNFSDAQREARSRYESEIPIDHDLSDARFTPASNGMTRKYEGIDIDYRRYRECTILRVALWSRDPRSPRYRNKRTRT